MIRIQGDHLEGGGQVLRLASALSSLTQVPIEVNNIRGNRPKKGLQNQHLLSLQWLGQACRARVSGAEKSSLNLTFEPGKDEERTPGYLPEHIKISQTTPGSVGLVLQAVLPYLLFSHCRPLNLSGVSTTLKLTIQGGTHASFSPSTDYIEHVLLPTLERIGFSPISMEVESRGWTHGRTEVGSVSFIIQPMRLDRYLPAFKLTNRGAISKISMHILAPITSGPKIRSHTISLLEKLHPGIPVKVGTVGDSKNDKRLYLLLVAHSKNGYILGRDLLWDRKIKDQDSAIRGLVKAVTHEISQEIQHGGCVDEYLQDQLVVFQALANGKSRVESKSASTTDKNGSESSNRQNGSLHTQTARWVAKQILGIEFDSNGNCEGIGLVVGQSNFIRDLKNIEKEVSELSVTQ